MDHGVCIVSPNYRLLPESTGPEVPDDFSDVWRWVHNDLQPLVSNSSQEEVEVDTSRILVQGESAVDCSLLDAISNQSTRISYTLDVQDSNIHLKWLPRHPICPEVALSL